VAEFVLDGKGISRSFTTDEFVLVRFGGGGKALKGSVVALACLRESDLIDDEDWMRVGGCLSKIFLLSFSDGRGGSIGLGRSMTGGDAVC